MTHLSKPLLPLVTADVPASLRSLLAQEGVSTTNYSTAPKSGRFVLYDSRRRARPHVEHDQMAIDIDGLRRSLPFDPFAKLAETTTCRTVWRVGPWEASEETANLDRAALCGVMVLWLRRLLELHGGVWMRLSPVPVPYRTAFSFRFDHDAYVADDFTAVLDAIAGCEQMTTHFVCAAPHKAHGNALQRLRGCDVGSHGYRHHTYRSPQDNALNIARGIETLQSLGCKPSGFAAPHGRYDAGLAKAMALCGITHSSEFAAAYDDWPFVPAGSDVLQIPVHPVCLGIVLEAAERAAPGDDAAKRRAADDVRDYFLATAEQKRSARAPIFLYGHPDGRLGRYPHILRDVLRLVDGWSDVWKTNYSDLQRWWRARSAVEVTVHETGGGYELRAKDLPQEHACALEWVRDEGVASFLLDGPVIQVGHDSMPFEPTSPVELPRPVRCEPIRGLKERLRRALDWEYVTPIAEIDGRPWRGRLKRTLRRWKERAA